LPQKKRKQGGQGHIADSPESPTCGSLPTPLAKSNTDADQDDETLIRETQAALKSLSGSWPDSRGNLYRLQEQDENPPPFQNLFEEKQKYEAIGNPSHAIQAQASSPNPNSTLFSRFHRQKENDQARLNAASGAGGVVHLEAQGRGKKTPDEDQDPELEDTSSSASGQGVYTQAASAFKPPIDIIKRNYVAAAHAHYSAYNAAAAAESAAGLAYYGYAAAAAASQQQQQQQQQHQQQQHQQLSTAFDIASQLGEKQRPKEPMADGKQYTILQPAGIGSRAASVMQDIASREGVVGVPLVATPPSTAAGSPAAAVPAAGPSTPSTPAPSYSAG